MILLILLFGAIICDLRSEREANKLKEERMQACMKLSRARIQQDSVNLIII
jgi:hypothetical protein